MQKDVHYYPHIDIDLIKNPNRWFAFPIFGGLVKFIILIPVFIELYFVVLLASFLSTLNAFYVLINHTYWPTAYDMNRNAIILSTKLQLFLFGLTNTYPGFDFQIHDAWKLDIPKPPTQPNPGFAIPIFGYLGRVLLLIPYFFFSAVLGHAAMLASVIASFPVCFSGKYPESLFEMVLDNTRVSLASTVYMFGISDTYPSFWISMKHMNIKIALLIAGTLLFLLHFPPFFWGTHQQPQPREMNYQRYPLNQQQNQQQPYYPQQYENNPPTQSNYQQSY